MDKNNLKNDSTEKPKLDEGLKNAKRPTKTSDKKDLEGIKKNSEANQESIANTTSSTEVSQNVVIQ